MERKKINQIAFGAIFIALVFVSTFIVKIPISAGWGYVHLGDSVVLLSGMLLGPVLGGLAAGLGSFIADILGGYAVYALPTLIIKAMAAFLVGLAYKNLKGESKTETNKALVTVYHFMVAYVVIVVGYFVTDLILAQLILVDTEGSTAYAYAAYGIIPNSIQILFGTTASLFLYKLLKKPFHDIYKY